MERNEQLEAIARAVASIDSTYHVDTTGAMECPFCDASQTQHHWLVEGLDFPHTPDCIVTRARALFKMAATENDILTWLRYAKEKGATHVVVACDTFSWTDYPVFVQPEHQIKKVVDGLDGKNMQKVMEVYNLAMDIETQLRERRAWHL